MIQGNFLSLIIKPWFQTAKPRKCKRKIKNRTLFDVRKSFVSFLRYYVLYKLQS